MLTRIPMFREKIGIGLLVTCTYICNNMRMEWSNVEKENGSTVLINDQCCAACTLRTHHFTFTHSAWSFILTMRFDSKFRPWRYEYCNCPIVNHHIVKSRFHSISAFIFPYFHTLLSLIFLFLPATHLFLNSHKQKVLSFTNILDTASSSLCSLFWLKTCQKWMWNIMRWGSFYFALYNNFS